MLRGVLQAEGKQHHMETEIHTKNDDSWRWLNTQINNKRLFFLLFIKTIFNRIDGKIKGKV